MCMVIIYTTYVYYTYNTCVCIIHMYYIIIYTLPTDIRTGSMKWERLVSILRIVKECIPYVRIHSTWLH